MAEPAESEPAGPLRPREAAVLPGRKVADRRIRVAPSPIARYFRQAAPGVITAREAATVDTRPLGRALARGRRTLLGRPIATADELGERLGKAKALAVFSSDALSSVAYATEAILFTLVIAGPPFFGLALPIALVIVSVLAIVTISYRQTIRAYPNGGGSYIVARANLGNLPGLVAAGALLTDYVLTVSVSVSAGVANLLSAFPAPELQHRTAFSVIAIAVIMVVNLRGIRESGNVFAIPTYLFVGSALLLVGAGLVRTVMGSPPHVTDVELVTTNLEGLSAILVLRAFADGCSAMTGVEAISNGVPAFKPPESRNARTTIAWMSALLAIMFVGITVLALQAGAGPALHETVISQLGRAVFGTGSALYYVLLVSTFFILVLAANTSFADFPRLSSLLARDRFMPTSFAFRGERLAFSVGIVALAALAGVVVVAFDARVDALIPLYAVGVFTSFTLSQAGMVVHWWRLREPGWRRSIVINAVGATATAIVAVIFGVAKFALGAWIVIIIIPTLVALMLFVRRAYRRSELQLAVEPEVVLGTRPSRASRVVIPAADLRRDVVAAVKFASTMSDEIVVVHVTDDLAGAGTMRARFERQLPGVRFVTIATPYRDLVNPLIHWLRTTAEQRTDARTVVLLPESVVRHWWERLLYNQNPRRIREALLGEPSIVVANLPYRT